MRRVLHLSKHIFQSKLLVEQKLLYFRCSGSVRMGSKSSLHETAIVTPQQIGTPTRIRENPAFKKIDTPELHGIFTPELTALINLFKKYNYEIRIAGGAVRDIIMNIAPKDVDLATTATPDQMKAMFITEEVRMINAKGEKHGTITPRINDKENFEVTTLRIDVRTDGRHAEVEFTTDWQLDANRRDLTINSMFLGFDGTLYDYFYGYEDLQQRRVIFVGDADKRIKEDYLRILRYFRFYGRIAGESNNHDKTTLEAIRNNVNGLAQISGERIWSEMQKIVVGNFAQELMMEIINCGVAPFCGLPEEPNVKEYERFCRELEKPDYPILALVALLHSCEDAMKLHERLRLSAFERDLALFITQQRDRVGKEYNSLIDYQKLCLEPKLHRQYVEQLLKYCGQLKMFQMLNAWKATFPLNGAILKERGFVASTKMGLILKELKSIWIDSNCTLTAEELLDKHLPIVSEKFTANESSPTSSPILSKKARKSKV